jgi:hypothetical protein
VNAVLHGENKDRPGIHVSTLLGCPRSAAIRATEPFTLNPLMSNAMATGTAWHAHMEKFSVDPKNTEVELSGSIAGIEVVGKADRLLPDELAVCDWKHGGDYSIKYAKDGAKPDHRAQLSLYADLCEQSQGWRPTTGRIWHHFSVSGKDALIVNEFLIWPLDTVLAYHPHGGAYSVLELLNQAASHSTWDQLPLAGESMAFGQKAFCSYCSQFSICMTQAKGAPF